MTMRVYIVERALDLRNFRPTRGTMWGRREPLRCEVLLRCRSHTDKLRKVIEVLVSRV
jgi:hypothetical protein